MRVLRWLVKHVNASGGLGDGQSNGRWARAVRPVDCAAVMPAWAADEQPPLVDDLWRQIIVQV